MVVRGLAPLLAAFVVGGCATTSSVVGSDVCPEYRSLRCMTAPECSMNHQRGCLVCACSPTGSGNPGDPLPNGVPPDRRVPGT
jgi:hypothetical protein